MAVDGAMEEVKAVFRCEPRSQGRPQAVVLTATPGQGCVVHRCQDPCRPPPCREVRVREGGVLQGLFTRVILSRPVCGLFGPPVAKLPLDGWPCPGRHSRTLVCRAGKLGDTTLGSLAV